MGFDFAVKSQYALAVAIDRAVGDVVTQYRIVPFGKCAFVLEVLVSRLLAGPGGAPLVADSGWRERAD